MLLLRILKYCSIYSIAYGKSRANINIPGDPTYTSLDEHDYVRVSSHE